jgi:hypothetical protein
MVIYYNLGGWEMIFNGEPKTDGKDIFTNVGPR